LKVEAKVEAAQPALMIEKSYNLSTLLGNREDEKVAIVARRLIEDLAAEEKLPHRLLLGCNLKVCKFLSFFHSK
jgi:hypothetical protein